MIRLILLIAVVALGADAILNDGAYTKAAWHELSSYVVTIQDNVADKVQVEKRE